MKFYLFVRLPSPTCIVCCIQYLTIFSILIDLPPKKREQASEHVVSTVQTCMKQYGVTAEEASDVLRGVMEDAWMDIVEECLDQKHPMALLEKAVNVARTMDFMYKREDAYTLSNSLKNVVTSMYVNSV